MHSNTDDVNHVQQNSELKERRKDQISNLYKYILFSLDKIRTHIFDTLQRQSRSVYIYINQCKWSSYVTLITKNVRRFVIPICGG